MKTVWIIDHYSSEPKYGGIQRQYDFGNELSKRGYNVVIISSSFSHFTHTYISDESMFISKINDNAHYVYLKTSSYVNNGGVKRIMNMFSFYLAVRRSYKKIAKILSKPSVVVGCSVHPLTWVISHKIAKKYSVKFIAEVRDLWPEMWLLNGEKSKFNPMVIFFAFIEKYIYKRADTIIYSMLYGDKYICDKLGYSREKVALIGQPMDCERFDRNALINYSLLPNELVDFIKDGFICVFTGYYMIYEGVFTMLEAAKQIQTFGLNIKFLFLGNGKEKENMDKYVKDNRLSNTLILGRISKELIPAVLNNCNVCLAHCAKEGRSESFKYGISKNKVNEYLYSNAAVIYGRNDSLDPVAKYCAGIVINPFSYSEFVEAIIKLYKLSDIEIKAIVNNGKDYIIKNHNVEILVDKLIKIYGF